MFGKSKLGDSVAAEMDRILGDAEFQSVFEKPDLASEYNSALANDQGAGYAAFVRVAKKKDDDEEIGKDDEDKKSKARPPKKDKKEDKDEKKKSEALAIEYILDSLNKTSEALDNMGFDKSATITLALINGIFKEASDKFAQDAASRVAELEGQTAGDLVFEEEDEPSEDDGLQFGGMKSENDVPKPPIDPSREPAPFEKTDPEELFEADDEEQKTCLPGDPMCGTLEADDAKKPLVPESPKDMDTQLKRFKDVQSADDEDDEDDDEEEDEDEDDKKKSKKDDKDKDKCGEGMMATAAKKDDKADKDKEKMAAAKKCASEAKKLMKKHKCKGTATVNDKGVVEVVCKGDKSDCAACKKEIMAHCKSAKVTCKCTVEVEKKAALITDRTILAAMRELDGWLKED